MNDLKSWSGIVGAINPNMTAAEEYRLARDRSRRVKRDMREAAPASSAIIEMAGGGLSDKQIDRAVRVQGYDAAGLPEGVHIKISSLSAKAERQD